MDISTQLVSAISSIWSLLQFLLQFPIGKQKNSKLSKLILKLNSFRKTYINNADSFSKKFAGAVFCSWQMAISGYNSFPVVILKG
jgi:hypothetical protein